MDGDESVCRCACCDQWREKIQYEKEFHAMGLIKSFLIGIGVRGEELAAAVERYWKTLKAAQGATEGTESTEGKKI